MQRVRWAAASVLVSGLLLAACAAPASVGSGSAGTATSDPATGSIQPAGSVTTVGPTSAEDLTSPADESSAEETAVQTPTPASTPASSGTAVKATSQPLPGCDPATLKTRTAGVLTFATGTPTAPWFASDNPADGAGFEAAVAGAVADRLGYHANAVTWTDAVKAKALAGTAANFDAFIGQVTIPDQPGTGVSYSTGYLDDATVLIAKEGSTASGAKTQADLAGLDLLSPKSAVVPAAVRAKVVTGVADVERGLAGSDGALVPLSAVTRVEQATGATAVAQLAPPPGQQPRQLGLVLPAGSSVGPCLSAALDTLRVDGTLHDLAKQWLPGADTPVLPAD